MGLRNSSGDVSEKSAAVNGAFCVWLMGLSASGKTTLAQLLARGAGPTGLQGRGPGRRHRADYPEQGVGLYLRGPGDQPAAHCGHGSKPGPPTGSDHRGGHLPLPRHSGRSAGHHRQISKFTSTVPWKSVSAATPKASIARPWPGKLKILLELTISLRPRCGRISR